MEPNVRFEGNIPNNKIDTYLQACDVVVLPSLMEATSISGLEAMAAGKPLVGTRTGGIPAIIDDRVTGLLVDPGSEVSLAAGLIELLRNPNRAAYGECARRRVVKDFSWSSIASATFGFYERILALDSAGGGRGISHTRL